MQLQLSIQQEDIATLNVYPPPNNRTVKYTKQKLTKLKEEIEKSRIIVGDFNALFLEAHRTTREEINKGAEKH